MQHTNPADFDVYEFRNSKSTTAFTLTIYAGRFPSFPAKINDVTVQRKTFSTPKLTILSYWKGSSLVGKEILFEAYSKDPEFEKLHVPVEERLEYVHAIIPIGAPAEVSGADKVLSGLEFFDDSKISVKKH